MAFHLTFRITLRERKEELDESEKAIETLIKGLDDQKEAALQRTFKMVARFFAEVSSFDFSVSTHGFRYFRNSPITAVLNC